MFGSRSRLLHVGRRFVLAGTQTGTVFSGALAAAGVFGAAILFAGAAGAPQTASGTDAAALQRYQHDVLPVLQANCLRCHGGMNRRGDYSMATRDRAIAGGHHGVAIVPGKPDESLLVKLIGPGPYPNDIKPMPLKGKLTDAEVATLRQWVADGAAMTP